MLSELLLCPVNFVTGDPEAGPQCCACQLDGDITISTHAIPVTFLQYLVVRSARGQALATGRLCLAPDAMLVQSVRSCPNLRRNVSLIDCEAT